MHVGAAVLALETRMIPPDLARSELRFVHRSAPTRFGGLDGHSAPMRELFTALASVAPRASTVLIEGESGTGKELCAKAIHDASPRRDGPFVVCDLGAISRTLMESE